MSREALSSLVEHPKFFSSTTYPDYSKVLSEELDDLRGLISINCSLVTGIIESEDFDNIEKIERLRTIDKKDYREILSKLLHIESGEKQIILANLLSDMVRLNIEIGNLENSEQKLKFYTDAAIRSKYVLKLVYEQLKYVVLEPAQVRLYKELEQKNIEWLTKIHKNILRTSRVEEVLLEVSLQ